jgi:hypothetical protein
MDTEELLLKDYELRVQYYSDHMQRVWTRFNFFITVESGLLAGLVFTRDEGGFTESALYFLIAEAVLSLVWWVFGAQDRQLIGLYRQQIDKTWSLLRKQSGASALPADYPYVGQTKDLPKRRGVSPVEWRWEPISITRLPAVVPLFLLVIWLALIVIRVITQ